MDSYFEQILSQLGPDSEVNEVEIQPDATWGLPAANASKIKGNQPETKF